jgi:hypothetical protein
MRAAWPHRCLSEGAPDRSGGTLSFGAYNMKKSLPPQFDEPVGIVISRGREPETTPRFSAYVWAPYPDDELEKETQTA